MGQNGRNVVRAETVGSLLQPEGLLKARQERQDGLKTAEELHAIEDAAVHDAIRLQESVGLDIVTDGEMRRAGWADTSRHLDGLELREATRSYPATVGAAASIMGAFEFPAVVRRITPREGERVGEE